jgi:hypothetical protein
MFRRAKLWLDVVPVEVVEAASVGGLLIGRLGLSDEDGWPICASVRPLKSSGLPVLADRPSPVQSLRTRSAKTGASGPRQQDCNSALRALHDDPIRAGFPNWSRANGRSNLSITSDKSCDELHRCGRRSST